MKKELMCLEKRADQMEKIISDTEDGNLEMDQEEEGASRVKKKRKELCENYLTPRKTAI